MADQEAAVAQTEADVEPPPLLPGGETEVKLSRAGLDAGAFERLAKELVGDTMVLSLNAFGNSCGDAGAASFAPALKKNATLTLLDLANN
eukprot:5407883-Prymnesium_polylepis.1